MGALERALPLIGVAVGWMLGERSRLFRARLEVRRLSRALKAECETNVALLPQHLALLDAVIAVLSAGQMVPGEHVHFPRDAYDAARTRLVPRLSTTERIVLHNAYERMRVADAFLDDLHRDVVAQSTGQEMPGVARSFVGPLADLKQSLEVAGSLLRSYLRGEPLDVAAGEIPR